MIAAIDIAKSEALTRAKTLSDNWPVEEAWISKLETEVLTIRQIYDDCNDQIDKAHKYPSLDIANAQYAVWGRRIDELVSDQKKLFQLILQITPNVSELRAMLFTPEEFNKMRLLQKEAGVQLELYHHQFAAQVADIDGRLAKISNIAEKALEEIGWVKQHPHRRLAQTIQRIRSGQVAPSAFSRLGDRVRRNTFDAYENLVGASEAKQPS